MSGQNVEAVRRAWEAFDRGDLEAFFADAAADAEFVMYGSRRGVIVRVRA